MVELAESGARAHVRVCLVELATSSEPRPEVGASARWAFYLLLTLVSFLACWDLWVLSQDQIYQGSDTFLQAIIHLDYLSRGLGGPGWFDSLGPKGPVAPVLGYLLLQLVGSAWAASRLLPIFCHLLLVVQCHDLGLRVGGTHRAGLVSAALCGLSPMVYGWGRLPFHDIVVAVMVLASLQIMLRVDLSRWRGAALLGLVLGLGLMTKLSFVIFMAAPGLWFLATRVRSRRQTVGLGVMTVTLLASCGWWLLPIAQEALSYASQSIARPQMDAWWVGLHHYLSLPGMGLISAGALVGTLALWRWRQGARSALWPLAGAVLLSLVVHGMVASYWSRYMVPMVPLAALLCGAGLAVALARLPSVWSRASSWGLTAALVGAFIGTNLVGDYQLQPARSGDAGLVSPDPRPYRGFAGAARAWGPSATELSWAQDCNFTDAASTGVEVLWHSRGLLLEESETPLRQRDRPIPVMLVRFQADRPVDQVEQGTTVSQDKKSAARWLLRQKDARRIWTAMDPDGLVYQAYWVGK